MIEWHFLPHIFHTNIRLSAVVLSLSLKTFSANSTQHANNTDIALQNVPSNEKNCSFINTLYNLSIW